MKHPRLRLAFFVWVSFVFAGVSLAQTAGPTLYAGPYDMASVPGVTFKLQVNGVDHPASCTVAKVGSLDCPRCDLSTVNPLGTVGLRMVAVPPPGNAASAAPSTVLELEFKRAQCATPNSVGAIRCPLDIIPKVTPAANACVSAPTLVWKTPPAGGSYRMYSVVNGTLSASITKKATAGAPCNCPSTPITSGTSTYCPLAGGPSNEVTLCVRVAQ